MPAISSYSTPSYNDWFISAIKSSKVDGKAEEKNLLQNCLSCSNQVKSSIDTNEENSLVKYEEFRLNCTTLLVLSCPTVNSSHQIACSEILTPIIRSLPPVDAETVFVVLKGLKNYKYLRGILPWLPLNVLKLLFSKFLQHSKTITPLTLAINYEMLFALSHALQYKTEEIGNLEQCLDEYVSYLKKIEVGFDSEQNCKLRGYHFLYINEALHTLMCLISETEIEAGPTIALGAKVKASRIPEKKELLSIYLDIIKKTTHNLLLVCSNIANLITSDIWISWHDIKAPAFGLSFTIDKKDIPEESKSIQVHVSHTVFKILLIMKKSQYDPRNPFSFSDYKELMAVFEHFAVDPSYDPDVNLSNSELIGAMQGMEDARTKKLFEILMERDDILSSEECHICAKKFINLLPKATILPFARKVIDKLQSSSEVLDGWKRVVIELCQRISGEELISLIHEKLDDGRSECLKTPEFSADLTQVFNQLSDQSNNKCYDPYVWLCLQSGVAVVKYSIDILVSMPGMAPVVAPALKTIHSICRSPSENEGRGLLTHLLIKALTNSNLTPESERELQTLILRLLERNISDEEGTFATASPVDVSEILEHIVCSRLIWNEQRSNISLVLPVEILMFLVECYTDVILQSEAHFSSLIVTLTLIYHNCCTLNCHDFNYKLTLRSSIEGILQRLFQQISQNEENYRKEISLATAALARYSLHRRCFALLSPVIRFTTLEDEDSPLLDRVFSLLLREAKQRNHNVKEVLPKCNKMEWDFVLFVLLPDCSEEEWEFLMHLTRVKFQASVGGINMVIGTLNYFQEVFILLCDSDSGLLPLRHCFKCFCSSAMNFLKDSLKGRSDKFRTFAHVFRWWCKCQRVLNCDSELSCLFLHHLCTALHDLLKANEISIRDGRRSKKEDLSGELEKASSLTMKTVDNNTNVDGDDRNLRNGSSQQTLVNNDQKLVNDDQTLVNGDQTLVICDQSLVNNNQKLVNDDQTLVNNDQTLVENGETFVNGISNFNDSSDLELITMDEFEETMKSVISVFFLSFQPNPLSSTIAGKLKAILELV